MIGRQVIPINKPITLQELEQIMQEHWDKEQYGNFKIGRPTKASIEEYILLPATHRYLIIVYPRKAGGLFSKEDKVILSTADTPQGAEIAVAEYFPTRGPLTKLLQTSSVLNAEKERKGPAEEVLQACTAHMKEILKESGLLK
ncbi:MAG: hypothetical protein IKD66_06130 [Solobacterium sp.]|nr:hypothetical protein [Solobacterium sp.]